LKDQSLYHFEKLPVFPMMRVKFTPTQIISLRFVLIYFQRRLIWLQITSFLRFYQAKICKYFFSVPCFFYSPRNLKAAFKAVGSVAKLSREHIFRSPALFLFLQNFLPTLCDYSRIEQYSLFHLTAETQVMNNARFVLDQVTLWQIYSSRSWLYGWR